MSQQPRLVPKFSWKYDEIYASRSSRTLCNPAGFWRVLTAKFTAKSTTTRQAIHYSRPDRIYEVTSQGERCTQQSGFSDYQDAFRIYRLGLVFYSTDIRSCAFADVYYHQRLFISIGGRCGNWCGHCSSVPVIGCSSVLLDLEEARQEMLRRHTIRRRQACQVRVFYWRTPSLKSICHDEVVPPTASCRPLSIHEFLDRQRNELWAGFMTMEL